jgi:hypothetical protein
MLAENLPQGRPRKVFHDGTLSDYGIDRMQSHRWCADYSDGWMRILTSRNSTGMFTY